MKNWIRAQLSYWRRCRHKSHVWRLPCLRGVTWQGQCYLHNRRHGCRWRWDEM